MLGFLVGGWIDGECRFFKLGGEPGGRDHFDYANFRRREQNVEGLDVRIEAPLFEVREDPLGVVLVIRRAHVMRARRQALHVAAQIGGIGDGSEPGLPLALGLTAPRRVAGERDVVGAVGQSWND